MTMAYNLSSSPHARDRWSTPFIMRIVALSLLPATLVGVLVNGWNAFAIVVLAIASAVATEWVCCKICKKPNSVWDCSAAVTGLLLALSLSPQTPLYAPVIGSVFAIAVCKCCFGGLGKNFINPALAGRCFLLISFGNAMTVFTKTTVDGVTGATPLAELGAGKAVNITQMFLGTSNAVIGSSILALLIGGLVLWSMDIIHGQICFSVLGGFTLFIGLFGGQGFDPKFLLAHLCGGGVVMGAFFMATDYVTSPVSRLGQFIYGCVIGVLGALFRLYGKSADSFSYSIIFGNLLTPMIDTYIVQKPFAYRKSAMKARTEGRKPLLQRIPKPVIALAIITMVAGVALSGVYTMTEENIAAQKEEERLASYKQVCAEAETFEEVPAAQSRLEELGGGIWGDSFGRSRINEVYACKDAEGNPVGYVMSVTNSDGFDGDVTLALGLTEDGEITGLAFTELHETPGMGMKADEPAFKEQFAGKSGTLKLVKGTAENDNEISAITGASVTSGAVWNAVNAGLNFYETVLKGGN